ncbi:MAG: cell division protein FtsA [Patescibacteria group bacterium]|nr:cell division protein FtsA [Patescibacteria group bacterium]
MSKSKIITVLDIGSGSIKILSVSKKPNDSGFEILWQGEEPSFGVRKGVVVDVLKVSEIVSSLVKKAEEELGQKINEVYASVGGSHLFSTSSKGLVSVSCADQKISGEDVERALRAAEIFSLPSNKEIINSFPKEFIIDGEGGVKDAVGMRGVRLEASVFVLCGFTPYLKNSNQAITDAGFSLNRLIPSPLASSRAVVTAREEELGVCVLDIGARTTSMAVLEEGMIIHSSVFPIGSGHITDDLATCLKTDIDTAEKIKIEFGSCFNVSQKSKRTDKKIKIKPFRKEIEIGNEDEELVISTNKLTQIIEARVSDILDLTNKELKKISRQELLPAGIILTGGGSKMPGIVGLTKKELKLPCRIGVSQEIPAFQEDPALSALYGLALEADDDMEVGGEPSWVSGRIKDKIKRVLRVFIP